jgi:hypothetical protein
VKLLRHLYAGQFGKDAVKALEKRFQVPETGKDGKPKDDTVLDEAAFCAEIERTLTDLQPVTEDELRSVALDRAMSIKDALVGTSAVDPARVFFLETDDQGEFKEGKIRLELKLAD